jgi:hypothetical protein
MKVEPAGALFRPARLNLVPAALSLFRDSFPDKVMRHASPWPPGPPRGRSAQRIALVGDNDRVQPKRRPAWVNV